MSRLRTIFIAVLVVTFAFGAGRSAADDTVLLKGDATNAAVSNLKGNETTDADTIPVFHGRILACLFPCLRGAAYYAPAPVYYGGCTGCFGGGYAPPVSYGYSCRLRRTLPHPHMLMPRQLHHDTLPCPHMLTPPQLNRSTLLSRPVPL